MDSPGRTQVTFSQQIWGEVIELDSRGNQCQNDGIFRKWLFENNFWYGQGRKFILYHRVSLVKARRNIYRMTLKGQLQNLTSDQGRVMIQVDPNRSYCTSFDAPWCGKHMGLILMSVSLLNQKLYANNLLTLVWPQTTSRGVTAQNLYVPGSSWMVKEDTIMRELQRTDAYLWNRKDFNIFPLTYDGSSKWPDLKSPIYIIRDIQVLGMYTYKTLKVWNWSEKRFGFGTTSNFNNRTREVWSRNLFWWPELTLPEIFFFC